MEAGEEVKEESAQSVEETSATLCQPCNINGEELEAEGYCQTCNEYLCEECFKGHTLPTICRNHIMLDKSQMPPKSANYKDIITRLETLKSEIDDNIKNVSENVTLTVEQIDTYAEDFKVFRKEIEGRLKAGEEELITLAAELKDETKTFSDDLLKDLQSNKAVILESTSNFGSLENDTSGLFEASSKLSELERTFKDKITKDKLLEYELKRSDTVQRLLSFNTRVGKLECEFMTTQTQKLAPQPSDFRNLEASRLPDIEVRTDDDDGKPRITGIAFVPPRTLLLADCHNQKVKAMDIKTHKIISELSLPYAPWDMALLPGKKEAAVTIPHLKKIQMILTSVPLSKLRSFKVTGECHGICCTNEKMIISFIEPFKVKVMNLAGNVLMKTIESDMILCHPYYLNVAKEGAQEIIYVSNRGSGDICKFTIDGKLVSETKHEQWKYLNAVLPVGNNQLLVSNDSGDTVDVVTECGEVVTLADEEKHGINGPDALCYCNGTLYVGSGINRSEPLIALKLSQKQKQEDN